MFEHRHEPLLPARIFIRRLFACLALALVVIGGALGIGVAGYHFVAGLPWVDALLNASMILAGMGPVNVLESNAAKIFASLYALFSGVVFISLMALLLSPIAHRVLHKFHLSDEDVNKDKEEKTATRQKAGKA